MPAALQAALILGAWTLVILMLTTGLWYLRHYLDLPAELLGAHERLLYQTYEEADPALFRLRGKVDLGVGLVDSPERAGILVWVTTSSSLRVPPASMPLSCAPMLSASLVTETRVWLVIVSVTAVPGISNT